MSRTYNPLQLTRPKLKPTTKEIVDAKDPNLKTTITLSPLDSLGQHRVSDISEEYRNKYIVKQEPFILGEEIVPLTDSIIQASVMLYVMQPEEATDKFSIEEFIAIGICLPNTWYQIVDLAGRVNKEYSLLPN